MAKKVPKDHEVRERIRTDLNVSCAVEAGAGTGKTTLLTDRILYAIRTGRAALNEMAVITFTERAANELKVRLRERIETELGRADDPVVVGRLQGALTDLETAHASTIHSFAAELLLERPVEAVVDPGFSISDQLGSTVLFDRVWSDWLSDQLGDTAGPLRCAYVAGLTGEQLKACARSLLAHRDLQLNGEELDLTAAHDAFVEAFVPRASELYEHVRTHCRSFDCSCHARVMAAYGAAAQMDGAAEADNLARVAGLSLGIKRPQKACKDRSVRDVCVAGLNELEELVSELRGPAGHTVACRLVRALGGMVEAYEAAKQQRAQLDFDDLLLKARDLLRDNRAVRRYFQKRFRMIFVDECQDTDPLQTEMVFFLAEDGAVASDWRDVKVAPGKLFFVGDPKQSIYRFRRADIEMYEEAKQVIGRSGTLETVSENFRSSASCVDWVNGVFGALIARPDDGDYQPDYVALHAWRTDTGPAVRVLRPPKKKVFSAIGEARAAEAAAVAGEIRAMVERGDTVLDKSSGEPRAVTYADVAVLFRTRTAFGLYEAALGAFEVPFRAVSGRGFFARQEVSELRTVLAAIERPYDGLAVVAALRTSLLGVSDEELAAAADGGFDYLARRRCPGRVAEVFDQLRRWHAERNLRSIAGLVQAVLSGTKALELFYLKPGGEQRAANLTKVVDNARAYGATAGATFGGFVRWLQQMTSAAEEEESPLAEDKGEFVKLITIHKAKGLEFPVVVLADLSASRKINIQLVVNRAEQSFDVQLGAERCGIMTLGFSEAKARERRVQDAEQRRLFYVAATRARDRLVLPHFPVGARPGGHLRYLADLAEEAGAAVKEVEQEVAVGITALTPPGGQGAFRVKLSGKRPRACQALCAERERWKTQRAGLMERAARGRRLATPSGLAEHEYQEHPNGGRDFVARQVGQAVHAVLERVDLSTGDGLAALATLEAAQNGVEDERERIERLAAGALGSDVVRRAAQAKRLYREAPFAVQVGGAVLEGKIDLAFDEGRGLVIVDYKTDDVDVEEVAEHARGYRCQVGAYALAAREVFGALPASVVLLFLRPGVEHAVECDDALVREVEEALK